MAGIKVRWSAEARIDLLDILDFYINRNGNTVYSHTLNSRIYKSIKLVAKNPFIGKNTDDPAVRAFISGDYQVIYEVFDNLILIIMIWDCRRDSEDKILDKRKK